MKYLSIILLLIVISCNKEPTSPLQEAPINVTDFGAFELELNTWSPDKQTGWSTRGGTMVVYFISGRYSQNKSNKTFEVDQYLRRGAILYQIIEDKITILGLGEGKIVDGFGKVKPIIYPNETYRHVARIDSVEILNVGAGIYYSNYWYTGEFDPDAIFNKSISKILGKKVVE